MFKKYKKYKSKYKKCSKLQKKDLLKGGSSKGQHTHTP